MDKATRMEGLFLPIETQLFKTKKKDIFSEIQLLLNNANECLKKQQQKNIYITCMFILHVLVTRKRPF